MTVDIPDRLSGFNPLPTRRRTRRQISIISTPCTFVLTQRQFKYPSIRPEAMRQPALRVGLSIQRRALNIYIFIRGIKINVPNRCDITCLTICYIDFSEIRWRSKISWLEINFRNKMNYLLGKCFRETGTVGHIH